MPVKAKRISNKSTRGGKVATPKQHATEIREPISVRSVQPMSSVLPPIPERTITQPAQVCEEECRSSWRCRLYAIAIFLFPFVVLPWTFAPHEFTKQLFLLIIVSVGLIIVLLKSQKDGTFTLLPRHLFVPLGILTLIVATVSALKSGAPFQGLLGEAGTGSLSVSGILLLGIWVLLSFHSGRENIHLPLRALIASGSILSFVTIVSLLGLNLYRFIPTQGFNPTGTTTSAGLIAAATVILAVGQLLSTKKRFKRFLYAAALLPPLILIIGTAFRAPLLIAAIGGVVLALLLLRSHRNLLSPRTLLVILIGVALVLALAIWPVTAFLNTPLEIGPSHRETWSIARQTLAENPWLGSGPVSFSSAYLRFRSLPILQTQFWNISFDWGSSAGLTFLTTLGWLGGSLIVLTTLSVLISFGTQRFRNRLVSTEHTQLSDHALFGAGIALFVGAWLVPMPLATRFFFDTLLGLMLARLSVAPLQLHFSARAQPLIGALAIVIVGAGLIMGARSGVAEVTAFRGVGSVSSSLPESETRLARAVRVAPRNDMYLRLLSDVRRLQLQQLLSQDPSQQDQQAVLESVRTLTEGVIAPARRASRLAPATPANWTTLGGVYLTIAPITSGAPQAAMEAFEQARLLAPSDPSILVNLAVAQTLKAQAEPGEAAALTTSAEKTLKRAIELRPSFALAHLELARLHGRANLSSQALDEYRTTASLTPGDAGLHYEIGLFLMRETRTDEAQTELEEAVRLAPNFSNAHWFLAQLLSERGETQRAIEHVTKVVELNPENTQAKTRLEELQKSTQ